MKNENLIRDWPKDSLVRVMKYPVCSNLERTDLYHGLRDVVFRAAPGEWSMFSCTSCGSAFLDPRPSDATLHLAYANYYTHRGPYAPNESPTEIRKLKRAIGNGYRNFRYGSRLIPASFLGVGLSLLPQRKAIDIECRFLPSNPG